MLETPYREKCTFKAFGPVDNGDQHLYGLDYKTAMWRGDEDNPFHTEVGYWLWDAGRIKKPPCSSWTSSTNLLRTLITTPFVGRAKPTTHSRCDKGGEHDRIGHTRSADVDQ